MKFTLSWLANFVAVDDLRSEQLADRLTMLGLEVDSVQNLAQGLEEIVTAHVVATHKHPNADRLTLCDVDTGEETVQIVCGAPNVRAGLITALAKPGTYLPDGMKIKKAKVRGEASAGMLCSARELGLSEDHSGIMELAPDLQPGLSLVEALHLADTMIEVDLTPNRPDCASVLGIAREVAGFTGRTLKKSAALQPVEQKGTVDFQVTIQEPELCPRYSARKLTNVQIGPSPWWLQRQLIAVGMRPINNVVDVTNYIMLAYGQPLHAFDFTCLRGKEITVRCPTGQEIAFTTLDGTQRTLETDMLMICDGEGPVAVAGVMGGLDSEVTASTTEVLLESACFNPVSIRKTARRLNLPSEASYRFERGVDPDLALVAMEQAVQLLVELTGAEVQGSVVDVYPGKKELTVLPLRVKRVCELLGMELSSQQVAAYLQGIEFIVHEAKKDLLEVTVPSFRIDIEREIDLVEEIARLVGYNDIPTTLPRISMEYPERDTLRLLRSKVSAMLTGQGFYEAINYSFVSEKHQEDMCLPANDQRRNTVRLVNPLNEDQAVMRTMLLPGLLENLRRNINFQQPDIRLFEIGKIFYHSETQELPDEQYQCCAVLSGSRYPEARPFHFAGDLGDFFDIKGVVENIVHGLRLQGNIGQISFAGGEIMQPYADLAVYQCVLDGEREIGRLGKVHPKVLKAFGIKQNVYFFELDLQAVFELPRSAKSFSSLPRYPSVKRDIALLVQETVPAGEILQALRAHKHEDVESVDIFDVYQGDSIEKGFKSVALSVTYRSMTKTLDDDTVDSIHGKIVQSLMADFGGRYREGIE